MGRFGMIELMIFRITRESTSNGKESWRRATLTRALSPLIACGQRASMALASARQAPQALPVSRTTTSCPMATCRFPASRKESCRRRRRRGRQRREGHERGAQMAARDLRAPARADRRDEQMLGRSADRPDRDGSPECQVQAQGTVDGNRDDRSAPRRSAVPYAEQEGANRPEPTDGIEERCAVLVTFAKASQGATVGSQPEMSGETHSGEHQGRSPELALRLDSWRGRVVRSHGAWS